MIVKDCPLSPTSKLAHDYNKKREKLYPFFDYDYQEEGVFERRQKELQSRTYQRQELATVLASYHKKLKYHDAALHQLEKLKDDNSLIVVGGQQPGLLTGPAYTIYKALSVIQLAKEQEVRLGVPVVPLFWIAGEDHDFEEVNHLFQLEKNKMTKSKVTQKHDLKTMLSSLQLDHEVTSEWVRSIFNGLPETEHTHDLLSIVLELMKRSHTFVDFFAEIISWMFREEGLLVLDSAHSEIRQLEKQFFVKLVEDNQKLQDNFIQQATELERAGYGNPVEIDPSNTNLFFVENGKRERIVKEGHLYKTHRKFFTLDELKMVAEKNPESLSNNVVTRPLMQEFLLPVLAFVAGPGEIAYWATLKKVFNEYSFKIPPLVPRISLTLIDRKTEKWMSDNQISEADVFSNKMSVLREEWYQNQNKFEIKSVSEQVKQNVGKAHEPLRQFADDIDVTSVQLATKNLEFLLSQIDTVSEKIEKRIRNKYESELNKFDEVESKLYPLQSPQERVFHIFYFLNAFGEDFITRTKELNLPSDGVHKFIYV
ncbi:bacillithiol biosynthesis cysteine-adding enzyme BshC [Bacillus alkalicellulosilyticus]|uniref:bacillithiol biosynthesis cysteine-adding enzyme BshC n=1 Tax=Alkalihalobacterium alkalicellulosilyticum TaxID=1912214 RepID=UPI0009972BE6|nr:bacillithiol biosynthesis cysteine-adding enzyme BshC [Bacillus alkalicellulosilyticus]